MGTEIYRGEWSTIDFLERLKDYINEIPDLTTKARLGYLDDKESLAIYTLPGSTTVREYYDGTEESSINLEIAMKSMDGRKAEQTMWAISQFLENLENLTSLDSSFDFDKIIVTSRPFVSGIHEQGWLVFVLNAKAFMTKYKKEKNT